MSNDKYAVPDYATTRVRYYSGQFLRDDDFIAAGNYHVGHQRRHERLLHVAGVTEGLSVSLAGAGSLVKVAPGSAVDDQGRQILLAAEQTLPIDPTLSGAVYVEIAFSEVESNPADQNSTVQANTRFTQVTTPASLSRTRTPGSLQLATLTVAAGTASAVSFADRVYSGLRLPGPAGASGGGALRSRGDATPGWAELSCSLSIKGNALISGSATVSGDAGIGGNATITGNVGVTGSATITGNAGVTGNATITGDAGVNGNLLVGTTSALQKLTIGGGGGIGFTGPTLNAYDKKLFSPADGLLRWQTSNAAGAHAFEVAHQATAATVHLDSAGTSWLTGGGLSLGATDAMGYQLRVAGGLLVDSGADFKATLSFGSLPRQMLNFYGTQYALGVQSSTLYLRTATHFAFYKGGAHNDSELTAGAGGTVQLVINGSGNVGIGTPTPRTALDTGAGVLSGAANDYLKAQLTLSGGGTVTWANSRLKWTNRFIAISAERGRTFAAGHVSVTMPTVDLPGAQVFDGTARSVNTAGLLLNAWEALYAVHTVGGDPSAWQLRIQSYTADFHAPSNWILIAVVNPEDGSVKLGTGAIIFPGQKLTVNGDATVVGVAQVGTLTFPAPPGDPAPVITARTIPAGQGNAGERTELILFHGNDGSNGSGPDTITLRAPTLRLQTYNDSSVFTIDDAKGSNDRLVVDPSGNVAIGTQAPLARLDIAQAARVGAHPAAVKGLYITGDFSPESDGVEIRHSNGTQGLGIAYSGIYATGNIADQHIFLTPRGAGKVVSRGNLLGPNTRPLQEQKVHRRILYGYAGHTRVDYDSTWKEFNFCYGPFGYSIPAVQAGATRKYRLYAIYTDSMSTVGQTDIRFRFDDGTVTLFSLPLTWGGGPGSGNNRESFSDWVTGASGAHAHLEIHTTVAGVNGSLYFLEMQAWDFFP